MEFVFSFNHIRVFEHVSRKLNISRFYLIIQNVAEQAVLKKSKINTFWAWIITFGSRMTSVFWIENWVFSVFTLILQRSYRLDFSKLCKLRDQTDFYMQIGNQFVILKLAVKVPANWMYVDYTSFSITVPMERYR